jgi:hypothetical protein
MNSNKINLTPVIISLLVLLVSGCYTSYKPEKLSNHYYVDKEAIKRDISRVAFLEMDNETGYPEISSQVTDQLYSELQKQQAFSVNVISKEDPRWVKMQLEDKRSYNIDEISMIYENLNQDALLFGKVTEYSPYPHLVIGFRLKLISLKDARLLWGFEQIWDSSDNTTGDRIKKYIQTRMSSDEEALKSELMTVSTRQFLKFAAYEAASTLRTE